MLVKIPWHKRADLSRKKEVSVITEGLDFAENPTPLRHFSKRRLAVVVAAIVIFAVGAIIFFFYFNYFQTKQNQKLEERVLTAADLENAGARLDSETSQASVDNLRKELTAKINKQIADKENPIETVRALVGVLCNTVNVDRAMQCVDYLKNILATKMGALALDSEYYGDLDDKQINAWRGEFYADIVNSYEFIRLNNLKTSDGKPIDIAAEQLKYIDLYLELANDPANWGDAQTSVEDGHTWYYYTYDNRDDFIELRAELKAGGVAQ